MFKISNNAVNRAGVFTAPLWGPASQCCGPLPAGQVEYLLHNIFPSIPFQKDTGFFDKPTFPQHGECFSDYGGGPFE